MTELKINIKTLVENGPALPIGIMDANGQYHKNFEVKDWTMKQERQLGKALEKHPKIKIGSYVPLVLAHLCTKLGGHDFTTMEDSEKLLVISQMYLGDVLFVFLWLRYEAMGSEISIDMPCTCGNAENKVFADLKDLDIRFADTVEDAEWIYELEKPFEIRGSMADKFLIRPPVWSFIENMKGNMGQNFAELKLSIIHGSVYAIEGAEPIPLTKDEFDDMRKKDIEYLTDTIDKKSVGPDFGITTECPDCKAVLKSSIQWASESFFAKPSR